ncbi:hypothetical protein [Dyadobacter sp. CY312]|uniref:hypothetical protein n=1 Tax=Dyadobacter sp. CY312 TaxID=2907303 RepID=UPI00286DB7E4|nr:hypothetical protein [Dyadobacter sp. CY312]
MKIKPIKFFSPQDNTSGQKAEKSKKLPTGYVSATGKLVFPKATLEELGIEATLPYFKIGTLEGKRKIKSLYLIPSDDEQGSFSLEKSGRGGVIPLSFILKKGGIDFESAKYTFTVSLFNYQEGVVGFELGLISSEPTIYR